MFINLVCEEESPEQAEAVIGEEAASPVLARMGRCVGIVWAMFMFSLGTGMSTELFGFLLDHCWLL